MIYDLEGFKPLHKRILVKPLKAEDKIGSIIIPDNAKETPTKGTVVGLGVDFKESEVPIKEGDHILYGKYAGTEFELRDKGGKVETYVVIHYTDAFAYWPKEVNKAQLKIDLPS